MKNYNLYVQPPWDSPEQKHALDVAFKGIEEFKYVEEQKAKRSDVPPMYRRNILADTLKGIGCTVVALLIINFILFFATVL